MREFARGTGWVLYNGDGLAVLPQLADEGVRVAAVVTDPPYCSGSGTAAGRAVDPRKKYLTDGSVHAKLPTFGGDARDQRSFEKWLAWIFQLCLDVAEPGAALCSFIDWRQLACAIDALQIAGWTYQGLLPWLKPPGAYRPRRGSFGQAAEFVPWGTNGPAPTDGPCLPGSCTARAPRGQARRHVTEKPLEVLDWLTGICRPGGVVLDPFAGSGTTGEAALRAGRDVILIEKSEAYCEVIAQRLEALAPPAGLRLAA